MSTVTMLNMAGQEAGTIELNDAVFGIEPNQNAVHAVVKNILANKRQGTQSAKTRAEVRGGGRKPFRQKGTGRHRQGSSTDPSQIGGGVVFAPKPRSYRFTVNKKVKRLAMKSAFSSKLQDSQIVVVDNVATENYSTKTIAAMLKAVGADKKALIVLDSNDTKVVNSARNIPGVKTAQVNTLNVYDIMNADKLVIAKGAISKIEEVYA